MGCVNGSYGNYVNFGFVKLSLMCGVVDEFV